jgi:hypothetical protein
VIALAIACSSQDDPDPPCAATLVVGVQGQPGLTGVVAALRVATTVDGAPTQSALYSVTDPTPLLPQEIKIEQPQGAEGKRVAIRIDGFAKPGIGASPAPSDPAPVLTRIADAPFVCGETRLVRLRLEAQCLVAGFPGAFAPSCTPPQSCQAGRCVSGTLLAQDLEPYAANWADDAPDACKPANAGPPEVLLGTGQTDFHPIGVDPINPEKGPQGGHHLWIAVRMKNLKQAGSTTTLTAVQPDSGITLPVTSFVFTFDRDDGGYCKLFGLRYQLDNAATPVETFLGKPLDVTAEVKDATGLSAKSTVRVNVGDTVVVPAGL